LCERKLLAGSLVRPFAHACASPGTYHFVCRPEGLLDPRIQALRSWLLSSLAAEST
jgi:DNA-binding transcriptional LysR family regulator